MNRCDLCIPKINVNIDKAFIKEKLQHLGRVIRMTELSLKTNPLYKRILFTIEWDEFKDNVELWKTRIANNQALKLIPYPNDPQFWLIAPSTCPTKPPQNAAVHN